MTESEKLFEISSDQRHQVLDELKRLHKDCKTYQQFLIKEKENTRTNNEKLYLEILDVLDFVDSFLDYLQNNSDFNSKFIERLPKQLKIIQKKLFSIVEKRNVKQIELKDTQPDFNLCKVVDRKLNNDIEEQTITEIVKKGFSIEDRILRPVEVITSKKG